MQDKKGCLQFFFPSSRLKERSASWRTGEGVRITVKANKKTFKFLLVNWLINVTVLYLASLFYPEDIVFGNAVLPAWSALLIISLILTLIAFLISPVIKILKLKAINKWLWGITYGAANIIILWLTARLANYTGFGISSVFSAITLGIVLAFIQYGIERVVGKK